MGLLYSCRVACAHSQYRSGKAEQRLAREQAAMRAATAACNHEIVEGEVPCRALAEQLQRGCRITRCSERVRGATRDEIGLGSRFLPDRLAGFADRGLDVRAKGRNEDALHAEQVKK